MMRNALFWLRRRVRPMRGHDAVAHRPIARSRGDLTSADSLTGASFAAVTCREKPQLITDRRSGTAAIGAARCGVSAPSARNDGAEAADQVVGLDDLAGRAGSDPCVAVPRPNAPTT